MTEAEVIRAVYPRHTMKFLALALGVPLDTARHWLYRNFCAARRRDLALALLKQIDEEDRQRAAIRKHLTEMAGSNVGLASARGSLATEPIKGEKAGAQTGGARSQRLSAPGVEGEC